MITLVAQDVRTAHPDDEVGWRRPSDVPVGSLEAAYVPEGSVKLACGEPENAVPDVGGGARRVHPRRTPSFAGLTDKAPYTLEWYLDANNRNVVLDWIKRDLTEHQRRTIGVAMYEILQHEGQDVVAGEFGDNLGGGLFEFRVRQGPEEILKRSKREGLADRLRASVEETRRTKNPEEILLRVFFHPHGDKLILLLAGYDKAKDPSRRRQQAEIELARKRLEEWKRSGRSEI